jgi:SAM-dependent methyltransferase
MNLRARLFRLYWRMESVIAPGLTYSQEQYERILRQHVTPRTRWLDIGCGQTLLPEWRRDAERELLEGVAHIVGTDLDLPSLQQNRSIASRVCSDVAGLPFAEDTFDLVTANMVVEHLVNPARQFAEIARILKPGGVFLFLTPNLRGYTTRAARLLPERIKPRLAGLLEGRSTEKVFPTFYRANTRETIQRAAKPAGLRVARFEYIRSSAEFAMIPPLALLELVWLRALATGKLEGLRQNLVVALRKDDPPRARDRVGEQAMKRAADVRAGLPA